MSIFDDVDSLVVPMRATALHAALLSNGATTPAIHFWRARCVALVEELQQALQDIGCPATMRDEVGLAQCVLLDELTLRALHPAQRSDWMRESLRAYFHGASDGAASVWARIDALLRDESRDRAVLALYGIVLELGFEGGRKDADMYRQRVWSILSQSSRSEWLSRVRKSAESAAMVTAPVQTRASNAPWLILAAVVAVSTLWIALDVNLNTKVGQLPTAPAALSDRSSEKGT